VIVLIPGTYDSRGEKVNEVNTYDVFGSHRWKNLINTSITLALAALLAVPSTASAGAQAKLEGFQEVPSVSTDAAGRFRAKLIRHEDTIKFKLSYAGIFRLAASVW